MNSTTATTTTFDQLGDFGAERITEYRVDFATPTDAVIGWEADESGTRTLHGTPAVAVRVNESRGETHVYFGHADVIVNRALTAAQGTAVAAFMAAQPYSADWREMLGRALDATQVFVFDELGRDLVPLDIMGDNWNAADVWGTGQVEDAIREWHAEMVDTQAAIAAAEMGRDA